MIMSDNCYRMDLGYKDIFVLTSHLDTLCTRLDWKPWSICIPVLYNNMAARTCLVLLMIFGFSSASCPPGYVAVESGEYCFFFSEISGTWAEANSYCRTFEAKLAEPDTFDRQAALVIAFNNTTNRHGEEFFIGGSDFFVESKWIWSTGRSPVVQTHWAHGNPNDSNSREDCMAAIYPSGNWNDIACDRKLRFICETNFSGGTVIG